MAGPEAVGVGAAGRAAGVGAAKGTLRYVRLRSNFRFAHPESSRNLVTGSCERQNLKTISQRSPSQLFRMFYGGKFKDVFPLNTLRKRLLAKKCVEK